MRTYRVRTKEINGYVIGVEPREVPRLNVIIGDLETELFSARDGGFVFEVRGERDSFWLQASEKGDLMVVRSQREGFFCEEIDEETMQGLKTDSEYWDALGAYVGDNL